MITPEVMTVEDLRPDPRPIIEQMTAEFEESSLIFGYVHGSLLYRPQGSFAAGYQEVRVFDPVTEQVTQVDYVPKVRPPDIDIVAAVEDKDLFAAYFQGLATEHRLGHNINYFFTLNVSDRAAHEREINSADPRAYKRILACRPTQGFGDVREYERARQTASDHIGPLDQAFQKELLTRKAMMNHGVENGHEPFSLSAEEFVHRFPLFYVNLHTYFGDFEEDRDKYVLPGNMEVKGKRYLGSDHIEPIR